MSDRNISEWNYTGNDCKVKAIINQAPQFALMRKTRYKQKQIPKVKLDEGISLCIANAQRHTRVAALLLQNNELHGASVALSFAVEEYGKALCLKEYRGSTQDPITVGFQRPPA